MEPSPKEKKHIDLYGILNVPRTATSSEIVFSLLGRK